MKIKTKIFLTLFLTSLIFIISGAGVFYYSALKDFRSSTDDRLETTIFSKAQSAELFLEVLKTRIIDFSSDGFIKKSLVDLQKDKNKTKVSQALSEHLVLNKILVDKNIYDVFVLDTEGKLVGAANLNGRIGQDFSQESFFLRAKGRGVSISPILWDKEFNQLGIIVSAQVFSGEEFVGIVVNRVRPDNLFSILEDRRGLGQSGEVYIADTQRQIASPSRFVPDAALEQKADTEAVDHCFLKHKQEEHAKIMSYRDYRGVPVFGSHYYLDEIDSCVLLKIDQREALIPLVRLILIFVLIGFLIILTFLLISYRLSSYIIRPIKKLEQGLEIIEQGNFNYKVGTDSKDEIGHLSRSFDRMARTINKSKLEIDKKVKEQTKEILKRNQEMQEQQKAIINILEDVEEEKVKVEKLAADLKKFELAVENASDQIIITDLEGIILYANKATEKITGYSIKEIIGQKAGGPNLWGSRMRKNFYKKMWETIKEEKKVFQGEINNVRKNGAEYVVLANIFPVLSNAGDVLFFVGIERDITKEKEIDKAKTEFVSLASHQLRTPLSTINWYAEILLSGDAGEIKGEQRSYLEEIYKGNQRMVELVNSLLNVSRIELGTFVVEPKNINIVEIAQESLSQFAVEIKKKKLKLKKTVKKDLPMVKADPKLMRIVFDNLLSNAVKYNFEGGSIGLKIGVKNRNIEIVVSDTGMGIPEEQHSSIFTKLFRADNVRGSNTEGTGLGLYIVKAIVEHTGGKITFKSKQNKGATFYISIPLKGMQKKKGTKKLS